VPAAQTTPGVNEAEDVKNEESGVLVWQDIQGLFVDCVDVKG